MTEERSVPMGGLRRLGPFDRRRGSRIEPYHGHGTAEAFFLKGRVLANAGVGASAAEDRPLRNLGNTVRRLSARGISGARVRARFGGAAVEGVTDARGYYRLRLPLEVPPPQTADGWHEVELALLAPAPATAEAPALSRVLVPPVGADFGIISDIDDTVVRTDATSLLRMLHIVLLTNAHGRLPFDHVDLLYRALQRGPDERGHNPLFYVSSSPWNLYDLLEEFFRIHGIPAGPLFLRDWDFSPRRLLRMGHQEHKLERIRHLFATYPLLRWVLIGDSGQEDPEIYRGVVRADPGRVLAVYIRDVTTPTRDREVQAIAREVEAMGVPMLLVEQKSEAAAHAAEIGLITRAAEQAMRRQEQEEQPPAEVTVPEWER